MRRGNVVERVEQADLQSGEVGRTERGGFGLLGDARR